MKNLLRVVVASLALFAAAAPSRANLPAWDLGPMADSLWDGERPYPVGKPLLYTSPIYIRQNQAYRDMKVHVMKLRLSGAVVLKYGVKTVLGRRYVYVIRYYPSDDPRMD